MDCQENLKHTDGGAIFVLSSSPAGGAEQPPPLQGGCRAVAGAAGADKAGDKRDFGDEDFEGSGGDGDLQPSGGGS